MDNVIQDLCLELRCEEAQAAGVEKGDCTCPCHGLASAEAVAAFARRLRGEQGAPS